MISQEKLADIKGLYSDFIALLEDGPPSSVRELEIARDVSSSLLALIPELLDEIDRLRRRESERPAHMVKMDLMGGGVA